MAIEKKMIPVAPWKGLYLDGVTVPGGLSKAENVIFLPDGTAERRPFERTLADTETCQASRGTKEVFELLKNDGTRYIYADIDNSETYTSAFGAEEVAHFATWTPTSGWTYDAVNTKWDHSAGTTALVATGESAIVAATKYRVVLDVTFPDIYGTSVTGKWTYASTDSGQTWTTSTGGTAIIWLNTWTHASGATTALTAEEDFDVVAGQSYVVKLYVTHTSGTGLSVYLGGDLLGTISSTGYHTFIARYVTNTTGLRFVPSSDWVGSIDKTFPRVPSKIDKWCSVVKLITPDADNIPTNYDYTESTYEPKSSYLNGAELLYIQPIYWYVEAASSVSQSLTVSLGGLAASSITTSGVHSFDITAVNTTALTITPTTAFTGSINSASVKKMTQATAATRCKVIGGTVTGTTDYEVTWGNILTDLSTGDTVHPQWAALQDRAFRVDGTNPNYWFEDATYYHTLGVPSPADAPVTANSTGGEITAGDYNVYYTYVKKYDDNYVVEGNPSPASAVTVSGSAITVAVIACTDLDVTNIRIYRTLYGEQGSYAYRCEEVKNATATITLTLTDDSIRDTLSTLEFNHDVPPLGKYVLGAGSRLWLVDTNGTLHWSVLDQPELMPAMNYQTFDPKDGDVMMGLCPLRKHILVFKRKRTWILDMFSESVSDDGVAALAKDVVSSTYGCVATGSIQPVGTDAAIWLSHAGFILYNGGSIKNISGGGIDADGNMIPSRIQDVINDFMAAGAEHFIDSAYHTARQLYHVNFLTRNAAGTAITAQRHFVYNLQSDSWSEYVYRDSSGDKMYETNFAMAHDSLGNEVILIPYITGVDGTVTYVYQGEYEHTTPTLETEILDSTGAGGTALDKPIYSFNDASDNTYVIDYNGDFFKVTSAGAKSCLSTSADITAAIGFSTSYISDFIVDLTNSCVYLAVNGDNAIVRITLAGVVSLVAEALTDVSYIPVGLNSDGSILYAWGGSGTAVRDRLYAISDPGGVGQSVSEIYDLGTYTDTENYEDIGCGTIYGDKLYYWSSLIVSGAYSGNYNLNIISDLSGTPSLASNDTGISATSTDATIHFAYDLHQIECKSDTEIYVYANDIEGDEYTGSGQIIRCLYSNGAWSFDTPISHFDVDTTSGPSTINVKRHCFVIKDDGGFIVTTQDDVRVYNEDWSLIETVDISGITINLCASTYVASEDTLIVCGYATDNVYKYESGTLQIGDTEPTMKNTIIHITSNYTDLGIPNEKRISRAYLDIDCKYPGCGAFYIEPDYRINYATHADDEVAEPSGAVSMRPFQHYGHRTWTYTNSSFDDDSEQWQPTRLDVGTKGTAFRYTIRAGDVSTNVTGTMRIRPPKLMVQVKELP